MYVCARTRVITFILPPWPKMKPLGVRAPSLSPHSLSSAYWIWFVWFELLEDLTQNPLAEEHMQIQAEIPRENSSL